MSLYKLLTRPRRLQGKAEPCSATPDALHERSTVWRKRAAEALPPMDLAYLEIAEMLAKLADHAEERKVRHPHGLT
jgi:hypothetical protein